MILPSAPSFLIPFSNIHSYNQMMHHFSLEKRASVHCAKTAGNGTNILIYNLKWKREEIAHSCFQNLYLYCINICKPVSSGSKNYNSPWISAGEYLSVFDHHKTGNASTYFLRCQEPLTVGRANKINHTCVLEEWYVRYPWNGYRGYSS